MDVFNIHVFSTTESREFYLLDFKKLTPPVFLFLQHAAACLA